MLLTRVVKGSSKQESAVSQEGPSGRSPTSITLPDGVKNSSDELWNLFVLYQLFGLGHTEPLSKGMARAASSGFMIDSAFSEVVSQAVHDIQGRKSP